MAVSFLADWAGMSAHITEQRNDPLENQNIRNRRNVKNDTIYQYGLRYIIFIVCLVLAIKSYCIEKTTDDLSRTRFR
jgi:hypothetical protein